MCGKELDSDGANSYAHEAVDSKIKYTLEIFERLTVRESNVELVLRDGAVNLSSDEVDGRDQGLADLSTLACDGAFV